MVLLFTSFYSTEADPTLILSYGSVSGKILQNGP